MASRFDGALTRAHRPIALVTGASAGLGAEFARQLARRGVDLVLVARDAARLERVADEVRRLGAGAEVLAADLLTEAGVDAVAQRIRDYDRPVEILVNNAGFGLREPFESSTEADELRLATLLQLVPLQLCHAAIPGMVARGRGWIVNVASAAAFVPSGSYAAAKLSLVSLSRSLHARLAPHGVHVTALCPGFVRTEFHERMGVSAMGVPAWMWCDAPTIVREGLRAVRRGRSVLVSDARYRLLRPIASVVPDRFMARWSAPRLAERRARGRG